VKALVLLAPAFRLVHRWQQQLGSEWDDWKRTGWREVFDYSKNGPSQISFGFIEDALALGTDLPNVMTTSLILHGTRDETVPIEYSRQLKERHPETVTLIEVDDGHQLLDTIPRLLAETDRFLAPYLK
jgi:pimeloyl-ACP methyl ester carboxylesterase